MTPETEVIACPGCKHLVRVPLDWLGTPVQCPECKAMFRAPTRVGGKLTDAELLSRPASPPDAPKPRPRLDPMLLLPAFGLLVCGCAGLAVGATNAVRYLRDADAPTQDVRQMIHEARKSGVFTDGPPEGGARAQFDDDLAAARGRPLRVLIPLFAVVSGFVFYGGVAMATRRHYRMAQLGCALAAVNLAYGCCVPGAVAGIWGLLMLGSEEGREHFRR